MSKAIYIFAGVNGVGKTTYAKQTLLKLGRDIAYFNADVIAMQLNLHNPEKVSLEAGKVLLSKLDEAVKGGRSFAFETTLSGRGYERKIIHWRSLGYNVVMFYLFTTNVETSILRIARRVRQGGHFVDAITVRRRFERSKVNFEEVFKPIVNMSILVESLEDVFKIIEVKKNDF